MIAAKLVLVPLLIAAITFAGVRFGPRIAGVLTGLPVVAGPIVFFMALEQGPAFAARSAAATLAGEASLAVFCVLYGRTALRLSAGGTARRTSALGAPWWTSVAVGWVGFAAATLVLDRLTPSLGVALGLALAAPFIVTGLTPRSEPSGPTATVVTGVEVALRMAAGVVLMLALTGIAHALGPRLSGLLTVFPVATTILAVFSHRAQGAAFAVQLLRGLAGGLYSLTAFFATLAFGLERLGLAPAFILATTAALGAQALALAVARTRSS